MKGKGKTTDESIRIEAYLLSEKAGHPAGMESYFWTQAEAIVHARDTAVAGAVKKAAAKKTSTKPKADAKPKAVAKPAVTAKTPAPAKGKIAKKPAVSGASELLALDGNASVSKRSRPPKK